MTYVKIVQFSISLQYPPSTPLVHLRPKFFHLVDLGRPISNKSPSPNELKESIKTKHNSRMTIICYQVLPSIGFRFRYQLINLVLGFPLTSFYLAKASLCAFLWLCTLLWAVVKKYHEMSFAYNYWHF